MEEELREVGTSCDEPVRATRFHGTTALGMRLVEAAPEVRRLIAQAGGSNVRVFGSVARGEDGPASDVDLVFDMGTEPMSLMELVELETRVQDALGVAVDLVSDGSLRPDIRRRVLEEAVAL